MRRAAAGMALLAFVLGVGRPAGATRNGAITPERLEAAACATAPSPPPAPPAVAGAQATVIVIVGPTTWVHFDATGTPIAALTNSGCAPRPDDAFLDADGAPLDATAARTVPACVDGGDWRRPVWVGLDC